MTVRKTDFNWGRVGEEHEPAMFPRFVMVHTVSSLHLVLLVKGRGGFPTLCPRKRKTRARSFSFPGGKSSEPSPPFTIRPHLGAHGDEQGLPRRIDIGPGPLLNIPRPFDHPEFVGEPKLDGVRRSSVGHQCELVSRKVRTSTPWPQQAGDSRTQAPTFS